VQHAAARVMSGALAQGVDLDAREMHVEPGDRDCARAVAKSMHAAALVTTPRICSHFLPSSVRRDGDRLSIKVPGRSLSHGTRSPSLCSAGSFSRVLGHCAL
jgi:hypothetical protein